MLAGPWQGDLTRMKHRLLIKPSVSCFATSVTSMLGYMSCGLHCA
jgi:hypothetical protein